ncbi:hypothetical protein D3C78_18020 [compost metagenome]
MIPYIGNMRILETTKKVMSQYRDTKVCKKSLQSVLLSLQSIGHITETNEEGKLKCQTALGAIYIFNIDQTFQFSMDQDLISSHQTFKQEFTFVESFLQAGL